MARVFLSYRRADGRYAVGWLAERLRQLDLVTDLRTAFQDGELRGGDDFPLALHEEVNACDVLVAVIGPNWLGRRGDGPARISDPADWVAREVGTALALDKRILPVLIEGAEPLSQGDLPEHLAPLADLHAVAFKEESDLDIVVADLASHLADIDRDRARTMGLEDEITPAPYRVGKLVAGGAVLAAALGSLGGLALATALPGDGAVEFQQHGTAWVVSVVVAVALWSGLAVVGQHFLWTHLVGLGFVRVRWRPVLLAFAFMILFAAFAVAAFATAPPLAWGAARIWVALASFVVLLGPWILTALGAAWTTPDAHDYELGKRTRIISELDRVNWVATAVLAAAGLTLVATSAAFTHVTTVIRPDSRTDELVVVISWGLLLSAATVAVFLWSRMQLRISSTALLRDLEAIHPQYRRNAEAALVREGLGVKRRWLLVCSWHRQVSA